MILGTYDDSNSVELARIVAQNLLHQAGGHVFAGFHGCHELSLFCRIVVSVVGTREQVILSDMLREVGQVFVAFAGDKEAAIFEKISAGFPGRFPAFGVVAPQLVDKKRDPACRSLDETKP